uniref:Ycf22 n=1 Tax=Anunuuluaehu liula TaxID=3049639 RepID=UPI0030015945
MNKVRSQNFWINVQNIIVFFIFICFTIIIWILINSNRQNQGYSLFIEFNNAHGIKEGTSLRMRGVNVGYIKNVKIDINSVLVLVHITSSRILIPKNSIIETNQTGLLNDAVIDIIPLEKMSIKDINNINVFSKECIKSRIVCHLNYLEGERGLNYDDLVRAATRISQRFDDPSFFNIFYLFLQNSIELSDDILSITIDISNTITLFYGFLNRFLKGHI